MEDSHVSAAASRGHQRSKSSVLRSFIHRRNNSDGTGLLPSQSDPTVATHIGNGQDPGYGAIHEQPFNMGLPGFAKQPRALGELQQNQQDHVPPRKDERPNSQGSPKKSALSTISLKSHKISKELPRGVRTAEASPPKPKKARSVTNLAGLLARPKSAKNLQKLAADDKARSAKDKENRTPPSSVTGDAAVAPPIYAQFRSDFLQGQQNPPSAYPYGRLDDPFAELPSNAGQHPELSLAEGVVVKPRPRSFHPQYMAKQETTSHRQPASSTRDAKKSKKDGTASQRSSTWGKKEKLTRPGVLAAFSGVGHKSKTVTAAKTKADGGPPFDDKDIDRHLEAMLDRRNIPENQRYKMRNLANTIKMEFIRQDWAEAQAKKLGRPASLDSDTSGEGPAESDHERHKSRTARVKSLSLSKGGSSSSTLSTKKKAEGTLGRHFRTKSTDSVASEGTSLSGSASSSSSLLSKLKSNQTPSDFVSYLRKGQKPELVEVGKLHKLRLLLRNETVAWTEDFIRQGGMKEIVGLLHRIMEIEWR